MFNISIYLDKFKNLESKSFNFNLKNEIIDSLSGVLKIKLNRNDVDIKNGIVHLKVNPVARNEIFINKAKIIKEFGFKKITIKNIF